MRILLVDDEKLMCDSLISVLKALSRDFEIISFSGHGCAKEAMNWLDKNEPDYCIFDILLNGISGLDLAQHTYDLYGNTVGIQFITGCALSTQHFESAESLVNAHSNMSYALKRETSATDNFVDNVIDGVMSASTKTLSATN